ncbi:MAG TPA: hypothetical protein VM221_10715 [Armatimonadota bacterium]|nr:hypothetical protein [Armatimonadota bacterium]
MRKPLGVVALAVIAMGLAIFARSRAWADDVPHSLANAVPLDGTEVDPSPDLDIVATFHDADGSTRIYFPLENAHDGIKFEPGQTVEFEAAYDQHSFPPVTGYQWQVSGPDGYHLETVTNTRNWTWVVPSRSDHYWVTLQLIL